MVYGKEWRKTSVKWNKAAMEILRQECSSSLARLSKDVDGEGMEAMQKAAVIVQTAASV